MRGSIGSARACSMARHLRHGPWAWPALLVAALPIFLGANRQRDLWMGLYDPPPIQKSGPLAAGYLKVGNQSFQGRFPQDLRLVDSVHTLAFHPGGPADQLLPHCLSVLQQLDALAAATRRPSDVGRISVAYWTWNVLLLRMGIQARDGDWAGLAQSLRNLRIHLSDDYTEPHKNSIYLGALELCWNLAPSPPPVAFQAEVERDLRQQLQEMSCENEIREDIPFRRRREDYGVFGPAYSWTRHTYGAEACQVCRIALEWNFRRKSKELLEMARKIDRREPYSIDFKEWELTDFIVRRMRLEATLSALAAYRYRCEHPGAWPSNSAGELKLPKETVLREQSGGALLCAYAPRLKNELHSFRFLTRRYGWPARDLIVLMVPPGDPASPATAHDRRKLLATFEPSPE